MSSRKTAGHRRSIGPQLSASAVVNEKSIAGDDEGCVSDGAGAAPGGSGTAGNLLHRVPVNDDCAEVIERRQNRIFELQQQNVPSPKRSATSGYVSKRSSSILANNLSGLSAPQLRDHYTNCMKLSSENKITVKNAFGLHLIDYMAEMLEKKDSEMNDFQKASFTLDASAKIYAYRVDFIHAEAHKIACGLTRSATDKRNRGDSDTEPDADDDPDGENARQNKKKRKVKRGNTIEQNVNSLNANKVDLQFEVDPLFQKTTELFADGGAGVGVLLATLGCRDDNCEIVLDSMEPTLNAAEQPKSQQEPSSVDISAFASALRGIASGNMKICPSFSDFQFGSWKPGETLGASWELSAVHTNNRGNDRLGDDMPHDDCDIHDHDDDGGGGGHDFISESDEQQEPVAEPCVEDPSQGLLDPDGMNLTQVLATRPSEYSYFVKEFASAWAGPNHWHVRPLSTAVSTTNGEAKGQKKRTKKPPFRLSFSVDVSGLDSHIVNPQALQILSRETRRQWKSENNTLPEDIHYDVQMLQRLFLKLMFMKGKKNKPAPRGADARLQNYNYNNANDVENFCPAADDCQGSPFSDDAHSRGMSHEFQESNVDYETQIGGQEASMAVEPVAAFAGDNLVQQPQKVAKLDIPYARTAKRVNVRNVKESMWKLLTSDTDNQTVEQETRAQTPIQPEHSFRDIYRQLPNMLSTEQCANMSIAIAFVCVLHLANEKNLDLLPQSDMMDFKINLENVGLSSEHS